MSELKTPAVIINCKVYTEVEGPKALHLSKICQKVADELGVSISVCPPMPSLELVAQSVDIPVFSQNVDPRKPGSGTGFGSSPLQGKDRERFYQLPFKRAQCLKAVFIKAIQGRVQFYCVP